MNANNLSIGATAELLGILRLTLSKITNAKGSVTPNIALRLEKAFGGNADLWLKVQRDYDLLEEKIKSDMSPPKIRRFEIS